jgi:hypothetical protein
MYIYIYISIISIYIYCNIYIYIHVRWLNHENLRSAVETAGLVACTVKAQKATSTAAGQDMVMVWSTWRRFQKKHGHDIGLYRDLQSQLKYRN